MIPSVYVRDGDFSAATQYRCTRRDCPGRKKNRMKVIILIAIVVVLAALAIFIVGRARGEQAESTGQTLYTLEFNPGPVVVEECKNSPPDTFKFYANKTTRSVRLAALDIWMGLYVGAVYDASVVVDVRRGGSDTQDGYTRVGTFRWDHYGDPSMPHQRYISLPAPLVVYPGDVLVVYATKCFISGTHSPLHPVVLFYFLDNPN